MSYPFLYAGGQKQNSAVMENRQYVKGVGSMQISSQFSVRLRHLVSGLNADEA